jgi:hypothetical protein
MIQEYTDRIRAVLCRVAVAGDYPIRTDAMVPSHA